MIIQVSNKFSFFFLGGLFTDNVFVTEIGYENLTTVPKEVEEIEKIISLSVWKGRSLDYKFVDEAVLCKLHAQNPVIKRRI